MLIRSVDPISLGERLRYAREYRGFTQYDLGFMCGVASTSISHFERDRRSPSIDNLTALADTLRVSLDWLLCRSTVMESQRDRQSSGLHLHVVEARIDGRWKTTPYCAPKKKDAEGFERSGREMFGYKREDSRIRKYIPE